MAKQILYGSTMANLKQNIMNDVPNREQRVLDARKAGKTWKQIADGEDLSSPGSAYRIWWRAMVRFQNVMQEQVDEVRAEELAKLDRIELENLDSIEQIQADLALPVKDRALVLAKLHEVQLKIQDRRAKFTGADAPQRIEASVSSFEDELAKLAGSSPSR